MSGSSLSRRMSEFLGVTLFATALVWLIALVTYNAADPVWFFNTGGQAPPANFIGRVGAFLSELSFQTLGYASYLIPTIFVVVFWHLFWCLAIDALYTKLIGVLLLFACLTSFLSLAFGTLNVSGKAFRAGGYAGDWLAAQLADYLNRTGSIIFILTLLFLAIILATQFSFGRLFGELFQHLGRWGTRMGRWGTRTVGAVRGWWEKRQRERQRQEVILKHRDNLLRELAFSQAGASTARTEVLAKTPPLARVANRANRDRGSTADATPLLSRTTPTTAIKRDRPAMIAPPPRVRETVSKAPAERRTAGFMLPPMALLDAPKAEQKIDERELMDSARLLEDKCREFAVEGAVSQIHPGPVVTTYELKPDAGVKYSKITSLADDLCLAMEAESVLIERIPGKSTVGIQIPNLAREQISLRELLESEAYRQSSSKLTLALGKTIHGEPFVTDLATMPHLLIAGSTGTGKSVAMNSMLTSILSRATPEEVRLILIDPKRLELGMYGDIPHLLTPVVVDPKLASNALRWAVTEMETRYKTLAAHGVRNIEQFNRNVRMLDSPRATSTFSEGDPKEVPKPLPYIIVAIDELADLMMIASAEVEEAIARLAQMARAVGIHLILATQRPSVDVITGLIKANLPARISFRVSSKTDSRTILDGNGAEQLLGKGDMLYLPPASSRFIRLHGPYISEQETARLTGFLRKQGQPGYDQSITSDEKASNSLEFDKDDLYERAARLIVSTGQASVSYLQRRLRIGFSRAARLVDMMEAEGLVSQGVGGRPREVLVQPNYFEEVDTQLR